MDVEPDDGHHRSFADDEDLGEEVATTAPSGVVLPTLAKRLEADLRIRFPDVAVRVIHGYGGTWVCRVTNDGRPWAEVATVIDDADQLSPRQAERLLAEITGDVADNAWPDELTEAWPLCPRHGDHPLQVGFTAGRAAWVCLRQPEVAIAVGELSKP